jgi:GTP-binding protein HflX
LVEFEHKKLIEIAGDGEIVARAVVLHPSFAGKSGDLLRAPEARLEEAVGLAAAIDLEVIEAQIVPVRRARPATLFGSGKVKEWAGALRALEPNLVVVDGTLTPVQQRNLETEWKTKVLDRTGLILEIFSARARTKEGRLQVELAHLSYQKSRLVRSWTHLERQRGGLGFVGGPGETQIESDRRMINERITKLKRQLETVTTTREVHRAGRRKVPYPIVALAGYTNAGKSTLFNKLTDSKVFAEDLLFATLDPTMREIELPGGKRVILSDTVGFISELPTDLIAAFRATLEEVTAANLIVHVSDEASPHVEAERADVLAVLEQLGVDQKQTRILNVSNKIDLLSTEDRSAVLERTGVQEDCIALSAVTGENLPEFLDTLETMLSDEDITALFKLAPDQGRAMAWLYQHGAVSDRVDSEEGVRLTVSLTEANMGRAEKEFSLTPLDPDQELAAQ